MTDPADAAPTTTGERACFEAGIKFGSLYHQFAGTPVSPESAPSLERAIEQAIENQPYCETVSVDIHADRIADAADHGYVELSGKYMDVDLRVDCDGSRVAASMTMTEGYPLMSVDAVDP